jgi:hypothetical protein
MFDCLKFALDDAVLLPLEKIQKGRAETKKRDNLLYHCRTGILFEYE